MQHIRKTGMRRCQCQHLHEDQGFLRLLSSCFEVILAHPPIYYDLIAYNNKIKNFSNCKKKKKNGSLVLSNQIS